MRVGARGVQQQPYKSNFVRSIRKRFRERGPSVDVDTKVRKKVQQEEICPAPFSSKKKALSKSVHKWPATTTTVEMVASARDDEPMDWRLRLQPSGIIIRKNPGPGLRDVRYPQRSGEDWSSLGCWICSCYRQLTERTDPPAGCATSQSQGVGWPSEIKGEVAMGGVIEGRVSTRRGAGAATG